MSRVFFIGILLFLGAFATKGQTVDELKKQQLENQKELDYTNKILKSVRVKQSASLDHLKVLQQNIRAREQSLKLYREEITGFDSQIVLSNDNIKTLAERQERLKKLYGELLSSVYFRSGTFDKWLYIFAAKDFSQAYSRYKYYEQFTGYTKTQLATINVLKDSIRSEGKKLEVLKEEKQQLVSKEKRAQLHLDEQRRVKQKEVNRLKSKEKDLLSRLRVQQQRDRNLERKIKELIRKTAKAEAKKPPTKKDIQLGKSFASNKGKLPWPTKGFVSSSFGEHRHPILKSVKVRNDGIDITTKRGSVCSALFEGEVSQVLSIQGLNNTVILKHGKYLSVYANLETLNVKKGDRVRTGQALGKIASNGEGVTVLKLQIWRETYKENPQNWLQRK